MLRDNWWSTSS